MRVLRLRALAAILLSWLPTVWAADLPRESRVPGGIAFVEVPGGEQAPRVMFGDYQTVVIRRAEHWVAVVGIPLATQPGPQTLQVFSGQGKSAVTFDVVDKHYRTQNLTI